MKNTMLLASIIGGLLLLPMAVQAYDGDSSVWVGDDDYFGGSSGADVIYGEDSSSDTW